MFSSLQLQQLDISGISGVLNGIFVTGDVLRIGQLDQFVTQEEQDLFEARTLGMAVAGSGANFNTGQVLFALNLTSGAFVQSGIAASGLYLAQLFDGHPSGLSAMGSVLTNSINNLSGSLNLTGSNYSPFVLSGIFNATGLAQAKAIQNLSGSMNQTGRYLELQTNNLSGSMNQSGLGLFNNVSNLSGSLVSTGRDIKDGLDALLAGKLAVNDLSGAVLITGTGTVSTFQFGDTVAVYIAPPGDDPAKVIDLNGLTGSLFVTGANGVSVSTFGSGITISGGTGISPLETGIFATALHLFESGQSLWARDLQWSGAIVAANLSIHSGLSTLNSITGDASIIGTGGITSSTGASTVYLSGSSATLPGWIDSSPDIFTPGSFDDDFDGPYLSSKWTGINLNLDSSGISNSHLYLNGKAGSSTNWSSVVQGISTGVQWEYSAKFDIIPRITDQSQFGLCFRNATTNRQTVFCAFDDNGGSNTFFIGNYTNNTFNSTIVNSGICPDDPAGVYLRVSYSPPIVSYDYSLDAIIWRNIFRSTESWVQNINQVGIFVNSQGAPNLAVDWFRATGLS